MTETPKALNILERDMNLLYNTLFDDCNILMNQYYGTIYDWFFISKDVFNALPYYNTSNLFQIRMRHLMKQAWDNSKKNNNIDINTKYPYPPFWRYYKNDMKIKKMIYGNNEFHFYGLNWNENTKQGCKKLIQFNKNNNIHTIQELKHFLDDNNGINLFTQFMDNNQICKQLCFKLILFAYKQNHNKLTFIKKIYQ